MKIIFVYSTKYCQRSNEDYHNDVETTLTEGCSSRGVKGPSIFSEFVKIPCQILFDKMHTTARGAQEDLNDLWLNSKYKNEKWYIGAPSLREEIDKRLSSVKYPMEFHRTTRSIKEYNTLKCS